MKTLKHPRFTFVKGNTYYYSRAVPVDLLRYYQQRRVVFSLRTNLKCVADRASRAYTIKLENYWLELRIADTKTPGEHFLRASLDGGGYCSATAALDYYLETKGRDRPQTFFRAARRNISYLVESIGDRPINKYTSADASRLRDWLIDRGLSNSSVRRVFGSVRAIFSLIIREQGLQLTNPFAGTYLPPEKVSSPRKPFPLTQLQRLSKECRENDDDIRWLIALIADTGMRLAEAVGLLASDLNLKDEIPTVRVVNHPHRRLKTQSSERTIPLVGSALWAAERVYSRNTTHCFPRYCGPDYCNSNSASATVNKWLKLQFGSGVVVHGLRHSLRDRLRNTGAPSDLIDQIGGWSPKSIGEQYGEGYSLENLQHWMRSIVVDHNDC